MANEFDNNVYCDFNATAAAAIAGADILLTYNLSWLAQDANLFKLLR